MTDTKSADDAARANSPAAPGDTPDVTDRVAPGAPPPAANQGEDEPAAPPADVPPDPATPAGANPQSPFAVPRDEGTAVPPGTAVPGNAAGVSVPATESAPGTSQQSKIVEGVRAGPGAVPGQPEGEVDTRG